MCQPERRVPFSSRQQGTAKHDKQEIIAAIGYYFWQLRQTAEGSRQDKLMEEEGEFHGGQENRNADSTESQRKLIYLELSLKHAITLGIRNVEVHV